MSHSATSALLVLSCLLAGCGGGSSDSGPAVPTAGGGQMPGGGAGQLPGEPAFGLTQREPLAPLNIPLNGGVLGNYDLENAFPNLNFPAAVFLTAVPGSNRLAVVQQDGYVRVFIDSAATAQSDLVLDLSGRVVFSGERGLLGLAFDPDFVQNRYLYVHYSRANSGSAGINHVSRVARFTWNAGTERADLATEKVILEINQPYSNHNGGMLAFGPDDYLYIGTGDGGSGGDPLNHAQDPSNLLGSMLRIDVHPANAADPYAVPADNPFVGQAGFRPETYAYGLRNPFRFSFDRGTGDLWLGDVGQGAREEIDIIEAGGNFGWRVFEGQLPFDDSLNTLPDSAFTPPIIDYGRSEGRAVIGGYVYRGSRIPSLQGQYLYGDYASGNLWSLAYDGTAQIVLSNELIGNANGPASFGEDASGDVQIVTLGGTIQRFTEVTAGTPADPPALLSQTGIFASLTNLTPAGGFIEYRLNQPFWSDGTEKRRWIAVPDGESVLFSGTDAWQFPLGTIMVKHFELALDEGDSNSLRRLETRLLVSRSDGWRGYTYRWNAAGTDADLLVGREFETITVQLAAGGVREQLYEYPSRTDCLGCHTQAAGVVLGPRTRQMNREFDYPAATDNQLRSWNNIDLFSSDIGAATSYESYPVLSDTSVALEPRVRAYLDSNCAQCHQPGAPAPTALDLRFETPLGQTGMVDVLPGAGGLGVADARIVAGGDRSRSVLWLRMARTDSNRMPPLGSHLVDEAALDLIGNWIDGL